MSNAPKNDAPSATDGSAGEDDGLENSQPVPVATDSAQPNQDKNVQNKPAKKPHKPRHGRHSRPKVIALVLVLLSLAGTSAASYWLYQDNLNYKTQLTELSASQQSLNEELAGLNSRLQEMKEIQQTLNSRTEMAESKDANFTVSLEQINKQLQDLASAKGKDPLLWRVAEVEYLLSVANYRLSLDRDVSTAMVVLHDADKRLRAIADPAFIPVREQISKELGQLNSVNLPDVAGMASQLAGLKEGLADLPFSKQQLSFNVDEPAQNAQESEHNNDANVPWYKAIWNDIATGLFHVQRSDEPIEPLLPPDEKQYLAQNLALLLEQSRNALLDSNTELFQENVNAMRKILETYYDSSDKKVQSFVSTLLQLAAVELKPVLPDISASLRELRAWIKRQQFAQSMPQDIALHIPTGGHAR